MKGVLIVLFCFAALKGFAQSDEVVIQEKSSEWIKVSAAVTTVKPKPTTASKKKTPAKKTTSEAKKTKDEFEKTNERVNRFKKTKKDN
jgi:hypothetical protein